jgi:predicted transcriptional regulator
MPPQVVTVKNASKVAAALANEKCQRILDYLTKHEDGTETQIAKDLHLPLSTVHYNMKVLSEANLVLTDTYSYSSKGKEVTHYRTNKNPIVIVQEEKQYFDLLKAVVPAAILAAGAGIIYQLATRTPVVAQETAMRTFGAEEMVADAAPMMAKAAPIEAVPPNMLPWFIAGIITTLALSLITLAVYQWWTARRA